MTGSDTVRYVARCPVDGCDHDAVWRGTKQAANGTAYTVTCNCRPTTATAATQDQRTEGEAA